MGPTAGSAAAPTFRVFVANDIPQTLNGGTAVNGTFSAGSVSATSYQSASVAVQSTLIGQTGLSYVGLGLNGFFDGTYWRTATDGTYNGAAFILSAYNTGVINFYSVASTGGTSQSLSNATLSTLLDGYIGPSGLVIGAPTGRCV